MYSKSKFLPLFLILIISFTFSNEDTINSIETRNCEELSNEDECIEMGCEWTMQITPNGFFEVCIDFEAMDDGGWEEGDECSSIENPFECFALGCEWNQDEGCFNYAFRKDGRADLSLAGWNYQALKAAYGAGCVEEGLSEAIQKGVAWLKARAAKSDYGKGFPYAEKDGTPAGSGKHTMRAVGVLCLQLFGEGKAPEMADELQAISEGDYTKLSWQEPPAESLYGWYYATQAMYQHGGKSWKRWNKRFEKELVQAQSKEGYWEYPGKWHGETQDLITDRVYATTLCSLMLTVYYRYLPSTQKIILKKSVQAPVETEEIDLIE